MQIRILWVISVLLLVSQLGYWLIDRGNTGSEIRKNYSALDQNKDKQNQLDNIIRRQDNKILYMMYKADSLKVELSNHQIAFDEYKRDTQRDIAVLESDLKSETSRRKSDDRKINNGLEPLNESVNALEKKVDMIKEKSFMSEDEYRRFKENQNN